jgi:PTS system ascorbate-specific IIB component
MEEKRDREMPMKILAVCGMGIGSSMILKMQIEKAIKALGISAKVDLADISTARGLAVSADIIVVSQELAERIGDVDAPIITITNFMDVNELTEKLRQAITEHD